MFRLGLRYVIVIVRDTLNVSDRVYQSRVWALSAADAALSTGNPLS
jgi:hypothetical protein